MESKSGKFKLEFVDWESIGAGYPGGILKDFDRGLIYIDVASFDDPRRWDHVRLFLQGLERNGRLDTFEPEPVQAETG